MDYPMECLSSIGVGVSSSKTCAKLHNIQMRQRHANHHELGQVSVDIDMCRSKSILKEACFNNTKQARAQLPESRWTICWLRALRRPLLRGRNI